MIEPTNFENSLSTSGPIANALLNEKDFELPSESLKFHVSDGSPIKEKTLSQISQIADNSNINMNLLGDFSNDEEETLKKTITDSPSKVSDESKDNESLANSLLNEKDFETLFTLLLYISQTVEHTCKKQVLWRG